MSDYEEYEYDENVARNISPERQSSHEGSNVSSTLESNHASDDEENSHSTVHRKKSDQAGFHSGKTRDEDKDVEVEGSCWYNRCCFSFFTFDPELMESKPKDNDNIRGNCKKCLKPCSGQVRSATNWVRHIKQHPDLYDDYKKKKKKERKQARDSVTVSSKTVAARKKRVAVRQSLLNFSSSKAPSKLSKLEQSKIDAVIVNLIITKAFPLNTVNDPAFIALINGLNPRANVMGPKKLRSLINEEKRKFEKEVTSALAAAKYVCLTADMWSTSHRAWIGITAHWLEENNLTRKSEALCCKRMTGSHTFDVISNFIENEIKRFDIKGKVCCIVTDNGANIKKAVQSMQDDYKERLNDIRLRKLEKAKSIREEKRKAKKAKNTPTVDVESGDDLGLDDFEDMNLQDFFYLEFDIGDSLESELIFDELEVSVGNILKTAISQEIDETGMQFNYNRSTLCEDIPCVTHSLYLVATADFKTVIDNCRSGIFKKPHEQAFGKLHKLWNLSNRSIQASELIYESLGCQLKTPCATRWNAEYDSVDCVLKQDQVSLNTAMKKLKLDVLDEFDIALLKEYKAVMGPLAKYLDVLQSETNNYLGCVIPCFQKIKIAMTECKDLAPNGYGVAISRGLMSHIERRFKPLLERDSLMIATTVHPRFKFNWIAKENEELTSKVRKLIEAELEQLDVLEETFHNEQLEDPLDIPSRATSVMNELDLFLIDNDRDLISLNKYPRIKDLFLRFNTALPSSAPVERLFSAGPLVLTIRRNRLSDELFETLLILKVHKSL